MRFTYMSAILWVLLSTFLWSVIWAAAKFADGAVGVFQLSFLRYLGSLATLLVLVRWQGGLSAHKSKQVGRHAARALSGCSAGVAITWASANMPLVDATAIGLLFGAIAVVLGVVVLKERVSSGQFGAILVSLIGVGIVMGTQGAFSGNVHLLPALVAFLSAVLFAIEGVLIRVLGKSEHAMTVMLHVTFFGMCLMALPAFFQWQSVNLQTQLFCLALGPVAIMGQYCTLRGYRSAPLTVVAPIDYSWVFFSAVLGAIMFGEIPSISTWIGCAIIMMSGGLLARGREPSGQSDASAR